MGTIADRSKGQVVAYVAAAILIAVAGFRYLAGDDGPKPAPVSIDESSTSADGNARGEEGGRLYVHVAGAVRRAGLYRLGAGTRVGAAIDRAGGIRPGADLSAVNLAAELQDGQQVVVPRRGAAPVAAAPLASAAPTSSATSSASVTGASSAPVSLAQATPEQLDATVEGIGPVLATRIVEFRDERGSVGSIDELREVDGIGEARLEALREALIP
jgi:competence protein ComEA